MLIAITILAIIFGSFSANMPNEKVTYHNWKEEGIMETIITEDVIEETIITENYIP